MSTLTIEPACPEPVEGVEPATIVLGGDEIAPNPSRGRELRSRSARGLAWTFAGQSLVFASQFATLAVLARLFTKPQMGVVTLILTAINLAILFGGCAFGRGLIQRHAPRDVDFTSAFWGAIAVGLLAWGACLPLAPVAARFFGEPALAPLFAACGAVLVLAAIWQVPAAILERQLRFREAETAHVAGYAVPCAVITIGAALAGAGPWSLVYGALAGSFLRAVLLVRAAGWRPRGRPLWSSARGLFTFGAGVTGAGAVAFAMTNVDYLIVGRVLGPAQLGLYAIAYQLATMPRSRIAQAVVRVAFPAFSRIQTDREQLNRAYIRLNRSVAFIVFPMLAGLFVLSEPAIELLFGARWTDAAVALRILCPAGAVMTIRATVGPVLTATGRPGLAFYSNLAVLFVSIPILVVAAPGGIERVALAVLAISLLNFLPLQLVLRRLTGLRVLRMLAALVRPALLALTTAVVVRLVVAGLSSPASEVVLGTLTGTACYGLLLLLFARPFLHGVRELVRSSEGRAA